MKGRMARMVGVAVVVYLCVVMGAVLETDKGLWCPKGTLDDPNSRARWAMIMRDGCADSVLTHSTLSLL